MSRISNRIGVHITGTNSTKRKGTVTKPVKSWADDVLQDQRSNPLRDEQGRILEHTNGKIRRL